MNLWRNKSHTAGLCESYIVVELLPKTEWGMSGVGEMGVMEEGSKAGTTEG